MVLRTRRLAALKSLLVAGLIAPGLEAGHSAAHLLAPEFEAEHFEAGHAEPIPHEHIEVAHAVVDEACVECALPHHASGLARLLQAGSSTILETRERTLDSSRDFVQLGFSPLRGRAPPAG